MSNDDTNSLAAQLRSRRKPADPAPAPAERVSSDEYKATTVRVHRRSWIEAQTIAKLANVTAQDVVDRLIRRFLVDEKLQAEILDEAAEQRR